MAGFYSWETVSLPLTITDPEGQPATEALVDCEEVVVTISQGRCRRVELGSSELAIDPETATIVASLTQEQTGLFQEGAAQVQVNILYRDSERDVTTKGSIEVHDNLHKKVMP